MHLGRNLQQHDVKRHFRYPLATKTKKGCVFALVALISHLNKWFMVVTGESRDFGSPIYLPLSETVFQSGLLTVADNRYGQVHCKGPTT